MSLLAISRVHSKYGTLAREIRKSSVEINFPNIQSQSVLVSEKFQVPEIDVVWWLEAVSADEKPKFSSTTSPPEIKIIIEVGDKDIMTSKLFDTKISVFVGRDNGHNQFIAEHFLIVYEQAIDDHRIEIDTTSAEYQNSPSRKNTENVYYKDQQSRVTYGLIDINSSKFKWNSLTGLNFSCSIFFNYLGKQDMCLQTKKELLSSAQSFISDRKFHFQT